MCGIAGILGSESSVDITLLHRFKQLLRHRGPDDCGDFINERRSVGFSQTRLSILDLSPAGHQPMTTRDGRFTIVFNGEIYNFRELRAELVQEGVAFSSNSDTEVLLQLYAMRGERMLERLLGMFAFAVWDEREQTCFMARDPLGIKPLYYWQHQGQLVFASEMRTLLSSDLAPKRIDESSLAEYFLFGYVPDPGTLVDGVRSLQAGQALTWHSGRCVTKTYWQPKYGAEDIAEQDAIEITRDALEQSMERHFVSDVPVGIFLSGGIDSTSILALARARGVSNLNTFCISFDEQEFNEGDAAARTAGHFGTEHHDWRLSAAEGQSLVNEFLCALDRPSNDGFNTFCVSKLAHRLGHKVVLSGLGGDELFGSYPSFQRLPKMLRLAKYLAPGRSAVRFIGQAIERRSSSTTRQRFGVFLQSSMTPLPAYWTLRGFFTPRETAVLLQHYTGKDCNVVCNALIEAQVPDQPTFADSVAYLETTRYMRNQLLRDSDVYSMANGLELRVPFVDSRLHEVVSEIPAAIRLRAGKQLLCDSVPEIPEWIVRAPKRGFRFPFEKWVNQLWASEFDRFDRTNPVRLVTWYRKWTLFTLEHFLSSCGIG